MLLSSSKRAFSSTSTATCLPFSMALEQALDDRRIASDAIQRDLDRQHFRIDRGAPQKFDHRLERIEGMMQQHVVAPQHREDIVFGFRMQLRRRVRQERSVLQIRPVERQRSGAGGPGPAGRPRDTRRAGPAPDSRSASRGCARESRARPAAAPRRGIAAARRLPRWFREDRRFPAPESRPRRRA